MKKLILLFCLIGFISKAQVYTMTHSGDTIVNTANKHVDLQLKDSWTNVSVQVVVYKLSGTVAGKPYFQVSNDGINYVTIDSLTTANVSVNSKIFNDSPARYAYYRVSYTGVGTMSAKLFGYMLPKK